MTEWLIWIKDQRMRPWPIQAVRDRVVQELTRNGFVVHLGPSVVIPEERHPGEWCLRVSNPVHLTRESVSEQTSRILNQFRFELLAAPQAAPARVRPPLPFREKTS